MFPGHQVQSVPLVRVHAAGSGITVARLHSLALAVRGIAPAVDLRSGPHCMSARQPLNFQGCE
jgi:hypothetical protein